MASVKYVGHACFEIALGDRSIYTDPWLEVKSERIDRLLPPAVTQDRIRRADLIFVSHDHDDHCDAYSINSIVSRTAAQVVAPEDVFARLNIPARCRVAVREGDAFSLMGVDIIVTPARHPQAMQAVGFIFSRGGKSVYFAGDTYDFYDMNKVDVDLALLPIGGTYTMDVLAAIKALKTMRARFVVPMHYNTFSRIMVDVNDFEKRVRASTKVTPIVLGVGESFEF